MADEKLGDRVTYDLKRYVDLRIDNIKLAAVEGLAAITGSAIALVICFFLVTIALMLFTGVFVYLVDLLVKSWVWSVVIIGVLYLIAGVLILKKHNFLHDRMVRIFAPMFFCSKEEEYDDDDDE